MGLPAVNALNWKPLFFANRRTGPVSVYPLAGLLLLHVPIGRAYIGFSQFFMAPPIGVLADREYGLIMPLRGAVGRQIQGYFEQGSNRLIPVVTEHDYGSQRLEDISVARYRPLGEIDGWFGPGAEAFIRAHRLGA